MRPKLLFLSMSIAAAFVLVACSGSTAAPAVDQAWARPAAAGADSAAYLTISGAAGQADALLSVSSPGANTVEVHETATDAAGMTGMHSMMGRLDIPAGGMVEFKPGGLHLMVMGLTRELAVGGTLELDLVFEHAGKVVVQAEIRQG